MNTTDLARHIDIATNNAAGIEMGKGYPNLAAKLNSGAVTRVHINVVSGDLHVAQVMVTFADKTYKVSINQTFSATDGATIRAYGAGLVAITAWADTVCLHLNA